MQYSSVVALSCVIVDRVSRRLSQHISTAFVRNVAHNSESSRLGIAHTTPSQSERGTSQMRRMADSSKANGLVPPGGVHCWNDDDTSIGPTTTGKKIALDLFHWLWLARGWMIHTRPSLRFARCGSKDRSDNASSRFPCNVPVGVPCRSTCLRRPRHTQPRAHL